MSDLLSTAAELDANDPLRGWRDEFFTPDPDLAYLDGNSLGMAPRRTLERVQHLMTGEWGTDLIASWGHWVDLPQRIGNELAPVIGASSGEVVVHDSTTVNLYQLVRAATKLRPDARAFAIDPADFPTDRYVVHGVAAEFGWDIREGFDDLDGVGVTVRSMIDYRTAAVTDMVAETERAKATGTVTIWDLSHAAGLHPVGLNAAGAELAVGCTYKYLNGGPGAPAFTFVAADLVDSIDQPIHGWFGQADQFVMGPNYDPRGDIGRMLIGTPAILALVAAREGIAITAEAGIDRIWAKAQQLGDFALAGCDELQLVSRSPRDGAARGGHISVHHPDAKRITGVLADEHRIVADFREPDVIRLGMSPLTTRFTDVARALTTIATLV